MTTLANLVELGKPIGVKLLAAIVEALSPAWSVFSLSLPAVGWNVQVVEISFQHVLQAKL